MFFEHCILMNKECPNHSMNRTQKLDKKSNDWELVHYEVWAFVHLRIAYNLYTNYNCYLHGFTTSFPLPSVAVTTLCGKCNFTNIFFLL